MPHLWMFRIRLLIFNGEQAMRSTVLSVCTIALLGLFVQSAMAAPALPITKPPVTGGALAGPIVDPNALQGQWFKDAITNHEEPRPYEFYDNVYPDYGGGWASSSAITGVVTNVVTDQTSGNILSFQVLASITNDTHPLPSTFWHPGFNSHGEFLDTHDAYQGPLLDVKLTTEFAISGLGNLPANWAAPYLQGEAGNYNPPVYIVAQGCDQLGWYCWTPDEDPLTTDGGYFVPTYDFGDIGLGQTVTKTLNFTATGDGIALGDNRFYRIMESKNVGYDIFLNRTTDLKIGDWLDTLDLDTGLPYQSQNEYVLRAGNVSVFFVPEPGTFLLLAMAGIIGLIYRWRRMK
jgi:hypothetical protein